MQGLDFISAIFFKAKYINWAFFAYRYEPSKQVDILCAENKLQIPVSTWSRIFIQKRNIYIEQF